MADPVTLTYGVLINAEYPHRDLMRYARRSEELGLDALWYADEKFYRETYTGLAACALATTRITLGTGVTEPYTRHPALTALAIASLDELSGGRAVLGFGAGRVAPGALRSKGAEFLVPLLRGAELAELTARGLKTELNRGIGGVQGTERGQALPERQAAAQVLRQLTEVTGGRYITAEGGFFLLTSRAKLKRIFSGLIDEWHSQYTITYEPNNVRQQGRWRTLRVQMEQADLTARTRHPPVPPRMASQV